MIQGTNRTPQWPRPPHPPKKQSFHLLTREAIAREEQQFNQMPRKCLGFRTPQEVFDTLRAHARPKSANVARRRPTKTPYHKTHYNFHSVPEYPINSFEILHKENYDKLVTQCQTCTSWWTLGHSSRKVGFAVSNTTAIGSWVYSCIRINSLFTMPLIAPVS